MFYLYSVHKIADSWDEVPHEKREWWFLAKTASDKQRLLHWHAKYKRNYPYKIVSSHRNLKDSFYPRAEIKRRTQTAQMLKAINYEN